MGEAGGDLIKIISFIQEAGDEVPMGVESGVERGVEGAVELVIAEAEP